MTMNILNKVSTSSGHDFFKNAQKLSTVIICAFALTMISSCSFPNFGDLFVTGDQESPTIPGDPPPVDNRAINTSAEQIILQWDPPTDAIARYDVYFRTHGTVDWTLLGQAQAVAQPEYTVLYSLLGNGSFDFAVASVNAEDYRSTFHTSLDPNAMPSTGWYISWQR